MSNKSWLTHGDVLLMISPRSAGQARSTAAACCRRRPTSSLRPRCPRQKSPTAAPSASAQGATCKNSPTAAAEHQTGAILALGLSLELGGLWPFCTRAPVIVVAPPATGGGQQSPNRCCSCRCPASFLRWRLSLPAFILILRSCTESRWAHTSLQNVEYPEIFQYIYIYIIYIPKTKTARQGMCSYFVSIVFPLYSRIVRRQVPKSMCLRPAASSLYSMSPGA